MLSPCEIKHCNLSVSPPTLKHISLCTHRFWILSQKKSLTTESVQKAFSMFINAETVDISYNHISKSSTPFCSLCSSPVFAHSVHAPRFTAA
jgi:hypothetical protein